MQVVFRCRLLWYVHCDLMGLAGKLGWARLTENWLLDIFVWNLLNLFSDLYGMLINTWPVTWILERKIFRH